MFGTGVLVRQREVVYQYGKEHGRDDAKDRGVLVHKRWARPVRRAFFCRGLSVKIPGCRLMRRVCFRGGARSAMRIFEV